MLSPQRPYLTVLLLVAAIVVTATEHAAQAFITPPLRALTLAVVATVWALFGTAAFELHKHRLELRTQLAATLSALNRSDTRQLGKCVDYLRRQNLNTFLDSRELMEFVRATTLLREALALAEQKQWAALYHLLLSDGGRTARTLAATDDLVPPAREHIADVLFKNMNAAAVYSGKSSPWPTENLILWVPLLLIRGESSAVSCATGIEQLYELTSGAHIKGAAHAEMRLFAYQSDAALLAAIEQYRGVLMNFDPRNISEHSAAVADVDDILRRARGLGIGDLGHVIRERLTECSDCEYAKALVINNLHASTYGDAVMHPDGVAPLVAAEALLASAADVLEEDILIVRHNIVVCLSRADVFGNVLEIERILNGIEGRPAISAGDKMYFAALRKIANRRIFEALSLLINIRDRNDLQYAGHVPRELRRYQASRADDLPGDDWREPWLEAAGNLYSGTAEASFFLGIYTPICQFTMHNYPTFYASLEATSG